MATRRYRCRHCGNSDRFDIVTFRRTHAYHHFTVGGELTIEDERVLEETDEAVCLVCDSKDIETLKV